MIATVAFLRVRTKMTANEPPYHDYHILACLRGRNGNTFEPEKRLHFVSHINITMYHIKLKKNSCVMKWTSFLICVIFLCFFIPFFNLQFSVSTTHYLTTACFHLLLDHSQYSTLLSSKLWRKIISFRHWWPRLSKWWLHPRHSLKSWRHNRPSFLDNRLWFYQHETLFTCSTAIKESHHLSS